MSKSSFIMRNVFCDRNSHGPLFHFMTILSLLWSSQIHWYESSSRVARVAVRALSYFLSTIDFLPRMHLRVRSDTLHIDVQELKFLSTLISLFRSKTLFCNLPWRLGEVSCRKGNVSRRLLNLALRFLYICKRSSLFFEYKLPNWRHERLTFSPSDEQVVSTDAYVTIRMNGTEVWLVITWREWDKAEVAALHQPQ